MSAAEPATKPPSKIGLLLYPGFQALDAFGPMDALNILSRHEKLEIAVLAADLSPVCTAVTPGAFGQTVMPTHTFDGAPDDLDVLLVPGGYGARDEEVTDRAAAFVRRAFPRLRYLLTVCTGAVIAAKAGVLDGRRATTNKKSFKWATPYGPAVDWVSHARWVTDGNIWTSSGVTAGMDMMYAFIAHNWGEERAQLVADVAEYRRHTDPNDDPFSHFAEV